MNLIDEDIALIRKYLNALSETTLKELKKTFWNIEGNEKTAWRDCEQCRHMEQGIIPYDFDMPVEFIKYLEILWKADNNVCKSLINALTVSVFRQKKSAGKGAESDTAIPSYIYNF